MIIHKKNSLNLIFLNDGCTGVLIPFDIFVEIFKKSKGIPVLLILGWVKRPKREFPIRNDLLIFQTSAKENQPFFHFQFWPLLPSLCPRGQLG